jgi:hypothetical protein
MIEPSEAVKGTTGAQRLAAGLGFATVKWYRRLRE